MLGSVYKATIEFLKRHRRVITATAQYTIAIGLLVWIIWSNWAPANGQGLAAAWQRHVEGGQPVRWGLYLLAVGICAVAVLQTFVRWYYLVRAQELPFTLWNALRLGLCGYFWNTFAPGSVGGDLFKAVGIARQQSRRTVAVATIVIDRVVGLWALVWLVAIMGGAFWLAGTLQGPAQPVCERIILVAAAIVAVSLLIWFTMGFLPPHRADIFARRLEKIPLVGHSLAELWRAVWIYRIKPRSVWLALAMAILGHVGFVLTFYFVSLTVLSPGEVPSAATQFLIIPIGMAVQAGIPLPGGVGAGEYIFGKLYELVGYPVANGVLMTLAYRVITWVLGFAGYLVYLRMPADVPEAETNSESDLAAAPPISSRMKEARVSAR
jgi:uncharacterized membrane protein YbhN (UPF0104 family)